MDHQIKHRWTNAVLYEGVAGMTVREMLEKATAAKVNLTEANLTGAYLADANLTGANLADAYLADANLTDANLTGAKWRGLVISKPPIQLFGLHWRVTILDAHMQIGCELHSLADWTAYDDARIAQMDGRNALRFWRSYKSVLLGLATAAERVAATASDKEKESA